MTKESALKKANNANIEPSTLSPILKQDPETAEHVASAKIKA